VRLSALQYQGLGVLIRVLMTRPRQDNALNAP
jgi:hypothetical protein